MTTFAPYPWSVDPMGDDVVLAIVGMGQSWMQGGSKDDDDPIATARPEHRGYALELSTGLRPRAGEAPRFIDLFERENPWQRQERPLSGCADAFQRAHLSRFGRRRTLIMINSTRGGSTLAGGLIPEDGLMPGSYFYDWMVTQVGYAANLVRDQGRRLIVVSIIAGHGETDAQIGVAGRPFAEGWSQVRRQAEADIRRLTGQAEPLLLHTYQTTGLHRRTMLYDGLERCDHMAELAWWQLRIGEIDPLCRCVGPVYWAERATNDLSHVDNRARRRIGEQFGNFVFADVLGEPRRPLRIEAVEWVAANRLRVTYGQSIAIETGNERVNVSNLGPGGGYEISRADVGARPAVLTLERDEGSPERFDLVLDRDVAGAGARLLAGFRPSGRGVGRHTGGRTAVRALRPFDRDPQDDFDLYDWACIEAVDLPA